MYYYLVGSLKRRLILELKGLFERHPVYKKIVPFIENKFAFDERPQYGIVIKGSSANKVRLSSDNFIGTVESHVMLAHVLQPSYPLEWVREDLKAVEANGGKIPISAGVYYLTVLSAPTAAQEEGYYVIDPLLTVSDEPVLKFQSGIERQAQLQQVPAQGTVRLWENRTNLLKEGTDYTVDYTTGTITLFSRFYPNATLVADYSHATPSIGPIAFHWNTADFTTLPGVVLAFGKRAATDDKVAIVVYDERVDTAKAYGGKFELTFELSVISQDPIQMEEISDFSIMGLEAYRKPVLEEEGIELLDISFGGEAEEAYDEAADLMYYTGSISVQLRADWEMHVPLPLTISKVTSAGVTTVAANELFFATSPVLLDRNSSFERIS